ncbi:hypothetical protein [Virgisporangium ochraceum]|uniref:Uncharacterized protein n=1 Tax=Virgisporangium ochraceum TaxID=65505 RepID=A0A8J3ZY46_9ACTN|nr:hypothetical protein [Virgisporangium ochraceum]GIJ72254.1 hypothetical protein Voc01_071710 [Virgisporangium ochraceum]
MQWYVATRRVVGFAVAFAVAVLGSAVYVDAVDAAPAPRMVTAMTGVGVGLGLLVLGTLLGLAITVPFWVWQAVRQTREHGSPGHGHLGYWGVGAFLVLFAAGFVVPGGVYAAAAPRVLGSALLVAGVLHTRAWVRGRTAPDRPYAADRYDLVSGGDTSSPLAAQPTADDWNAAQWDPDVDRQIERRRHRG